MPGPTGPDLPPPQRDAVNPQQGEEQPRPPQGPPSQAVETMPSAALPPAVRVAHESVDVKATTEALAGSTPEEIPPPSPDLDPSFVNVIGKIGSELDDILTRNPKQLQFGPIYFIPMHDGSMQQVVTIFYDLANGKRRRFESLALDPNGYPIGSRSSTVTHYAGYEGEKHAEVTSYIVTGLRNRGLSTPLELANIDILQREAARLKEFGYDEGMQFYISNANKRELERLEHEYEQTHDTSLLPQIEAQRQEQKRWQSIYGPEGWLGFDASGKKILTGDSATGSGPSSEVVIRRDGNESVVEDVKPLSPDEQAAYRAAQLARLETTITRIKTVTTPSLPHSTQDEPSTQ